MAPKLLHCLLQVCFDDTPDEPTLNNRSVPPQQNHIFRLLPPAETSLSHAAAYTLAQVEEPAGENGGVEGRGICCETNNSNNHNNDDAAAINIRMSGIREFWKTVQERLNLTPSVETAPTTTSASESQEEQEYVPILTEASSFDSSKEVPTISTDQVVLPGSDLQMEMAKAMLAQLGTNKGHEHDDECVICMEGFDPTNPRMPTLCGCGENKTYFHLPCLYQWVDQGGSKCPSCRKRLRWEEF